MLRTKIAILFGLILYININALDNNNNNNNNNKRKSSENIEIAQNPAKKCYMDIESIINSIDYKDGQVLMNIFSNFSVDVIENLIKENKIDFHKFRYDPLICAVDINKPEIVKLFINNGFYKNIIKKEYITSLNRENHIYDNAFICAVGQDKIDIVKILIENSHLLNNDDDKKNYTTILIVSLIVQFDKPIADMIQIIFDELISFCNKNNLSIKDIINQKITHHQLCSWNLLGAAIKANNKLYIEKIVSYGANIDNNVDYLGNALEVAIAKQRDSQIIKFLFMNAPKDIKITSDNPRVEEGYKKFIINDITLLPKELIDIIIEYTNRFF